jgi:hypothetical protein
MDQLLKLIEEIKADITGISDRLRCIEEALVANQSSNTRTIPPASEDVSPLGTTPDPLRGLTAEHGLHCLKDEWVQISYLAQQCQHLAVGTNFENACRRTRCDAPRRWEREGSMLYLNPHGEKLDPDQTMRESRLERAMFLRWGGPDSLPVTDVWHRVIKYQVPLKERRRSTAGLKAIDLLAVTAEGYPVVVELKVKHPSPETPLRAILEAAAYGCVLEAAWKPRFRQELIERLRQNSVIGDALPPELRGCRLVVAAPGDYWDFWSTHQYMRRAAPAFRDFLNKAREYRFPVTFVRIEGTSGDWQDRLPHNWQELRAEKITFPPG